jgi:hypothetical protein
MTGMTLNEPYVVDNGQLSAFRSRGEVTLEWESGNAAKNGDMTMETLTWDYVGLPSLLVQAAADDNPRHGYEAVCGEPTNLKRHVDLLREVHDDVGRLVEHLENGNYRNVAEQDKPYANE